MPSIFQGRWRSPESKAAPWLEWPGASSASKRLAEKRSTNSAKADLCVANTGFLVVKLYTAGAKAHEDSLPSLKRRKALPRGRSLAPFRRQTEVKEKHR